MFCKNIILITIFLFLTNCTTGTLVKIKPNVTVVNGYLNKGFALVYSEDFYKNVVYELEILV